MKKISLLILMSFLSLFLNAQRDIVVGKHPNKFFKSYEDYKANKPIDGVVLIKWSSNSTGKIELSENGVAQKLKVSKLTYTWFCNEEGVLMRLYDGELYYVVVDGPFTYYAQSSKTWVARYGDADFSLVPQLSGSKIADRYSETPNGEIKKFSESVLKEYLAKYGLKDQYDADKMKREFKDNVASYEDKQQLKLIKYMILLNEKMK